MFTLSQLRCFIAIAEERHFGRAAMRLHMTQPPLSRQLALLETELGIRLVNRSSHGVELTVAGSAFLHDARQLLRSAEESAASARLAASGEIGHLSIGFTAASAYELLPALIRDYRNAHPRIGLSLKEMVTLAQVDQLVAGKLDVGLIRPSIDLSRFGAIRLAVDGLVAAVPSAHPLASKRTVGIEDFHREPFISHSPIEAKYFFDITSELFRAERVEPVTVQSLAQPHAILSMVRAGLGIAIVADLVRRHSVGTDIEFKKLRFSRKAPRIEMFLIWRKEHRTPALDHFIQGAREAKLRLRR